MKKFLLAVIVIAAAVFTGCSKEEKSDDLAGTSWSVVKYETSWREEVTLSFKSNHQVELIGDAEYFPSYDHEGFIEVGTYKYDYPTVTLSMRDVDGDLKDYKGVLLGNKMDLYEVYQNAEYHKYSLTKK